MFVPNQSSSSSMFDKNRLIPLDVRYTDFLNALADISNETVRDRCHKHWTSLYRYFDRSRTNEQVLQLEERRIQEVLHRLDLEMVSQQSDIAYQVRNVLQRGQQVLADLHFKYNQKKENSTEIQENIAHLEHQIQREKSKHSLSASSSIASLSISSNHINETIDELKAEINNLYLIREGYQTELNHHNGNYFSTQIQAYHIQQMIHKMEIEFKDIQHDLSLNLKENFERNRQLQQYQQNLDIFFHQEHFHDDLQRMGEQMVNEEKRIFELKNQNKQISYDHLSQVALLKIEEHRQKELHIEEKHLSENIDKLLEEIGKEKAIRQEDLQLLIYFKRKLKRKEQTLSTQYRQEKKLKNRTHDLEHQRDARLQHPIVSAENNLPESNETLKKTIKQEVNHRLQLTLLYHNLKSEHNELTGTINEYAILVKTQREKILHYEKLHDQWILDMNSNRKHLVALFQRMDALEQSTTKTKTFLEQFNQIKLSLRPNLLILYHQMNLYIQQRREKNDIHRSTIHESKNSLTMKTNQSKQILRSKRHLSDQIERNLSLLKTNAALLSNQIGTVNKQQMHLNQHLYLLRNKTLVQEQAMANVLNQLDQSESSINSNKERLRQFQSQRQNLSSLLFRKQYLIRLLRKRIQFNEKNLRKHHLSHQQLLRKLQQTKMAVLSQRKPLSISDRQNQSDFKETILHLRKELLECRKKNNDYQHRINRRHLTRQIGTPFNNQSIRNGTQPEYHRNLQQKLSSIIYRLICKTHSNILLHQHLDLLMQKTVLLHSVHQQSVHQSSPSAPNHSVNLGHLDKQLKSSIAELRLLKNEIRLSKDLYLHLKLTLANHETKKEERKALLHQQ